MNDTIKTIHSLRTIHGNFSDKKISDNDLETILQASVCAATASARQTYSILVIRDKEKMHQLSEYIGDVLLIFCVDFTRLIELAKHLNHEFDVSDAIGFVTGSTDTIMAAQTACIAAKSLGIDSLFTQRGMHRRDIAKVFDILNLPEQYCFPLVALVLGYPRAEPEFQKGRLTGKSIIHWGTYHCLSTDEKEALVAQYDDTNKHLGLIDNWAQLGMKHYLDWFYSKWSQRVDTKNFVTALKKSGFLPSE
ncbi:MAG: nitroreductase family protein [Gammaproteobacteria bacterium]|nr:nitroreductase family protein [Gammaproteobacteria bacterium]